MSALAGLAALDHPFVSDHPGVVVHGLVAAVPQTPGHAPREDRYRLAADWCAAGPFLPLAWSRDVSMGDVGACAFAQSGDMRGAIDAVAGLVEFAVRIERRSLPAAPCGPSADGAGRAYLRSLKAGQVSCETALTELLAMARDGAWTVSLVNRREREASCLVGCAIAAAACLRGAVDALGHRHPALQLVIAGPFPPFGAGAQALARMGFPRSGDRA